MSPVGPFLAGLSLGLLAGWWAAWRLTWSIVEEALTPAPGGAWPEFRPDPLEVAMARRLLTDEQLQAYVADGGVHCPRCGHDGFTTDEDYEEVDGTTATRLVVCEECGERVREVYTLTRAEAPT